MARLVFIDKTFAGQSYQFTREKTTVGRGDQNDLVIRDSSVSSRHCEILVYGYDVIVIDLNSSNGTFINGLRLKGQAQLKSGQVVGFGSVEARLELDPPTDWDDASAITAVQALRHYERQQQHAPASPPPAKVSLTPAAAPAANSAEQTILMPRPAPPQPALVPQASTPAEATPRTPSKSKILLLAVAVGAVLLLLAWVLWNRL